MRSGGFLSGSGETTANPEARAIVGERWSLHEAGRGRLRIELKSFAHFDALIRALDIVPGAFVWRGHAAQEWALEPSLDRLRKRAGFAVNEALSARHLATFKRAVRGRMGSSTPPSDDNENGWWALGQHYGLATPLLDWTNSPWVAAYFAYETVPAEPSKGCCVVGLSRLWCADVSTTVARSFRGPGRAPVLEFVDPSSHDNARLIAQDGVFTRAPDGVPVEAWIEEHTKPTERNVHLLHIVLPPAERIAALRHLGGMQIAHRTLYPDLIGAAATSNHEYEHLGPWPQFYHQEQLIPSATRAAEVEAAEAVPPTQLDPVRSSLRVDRPLFARGEPLNARVTFTARDRDGKPLAGVETKYEVKVVGPLGNPFYSNEA